jgi:hypothetical protein
MTNKPPDNLVLGTMAHFAERNGDVANQYKKRLSQDRRPTTRSSTEGWVNWDGASEVLGQPYNVSQIPLSKLEQMQRDPMLSFGLMFVKVPLIRAPWYIKSSDAQRAAFVDNALRKIYGRLILAYSNSLAFGFSGIVKRFEYDIPDWTYIDKDNPDGTESRVWENDNVKALIWKPFLALNPRYTVPHWNSRGEFAGIDYNTISTSSVFSFFNSNKNSGRAADIPLDWSLWATNEKDSVYGSLWGYPRLGYSFRYWWSYWYLFSLSDRAFERWADPPTIVYHPSDTGIDDEGNEVDYSTEGLNVAEKFRSGANISLPGSAITSGLDDKASNMREWEINQIKSEVNFNAMDSWFKYLDVQKLRSLMVPEQSLMEGQGGSSSRNVAEQFGDVFQESQVVVMQEIDDMINRYMIPQLLEANFGPGGPSCTKITTGFDPSDIETMRTIVGAFANKDAEIPVDMRETLERLGVPTMSQEAYKNYLDKKAEEAEKALASQVQATKDAAGVTKTGLYYDDREVIVLSDEEHGTMRKVFDKLLGKNKEETTDKDQK